MRPRHALLLTMVILAGCSLFEPKKSPPGTPQRACEDAADADPKVRDYWATTSSNTPPPDFDRGYKIARDRAIAECLRIRAGLPSGGVEKPIR